MRKQKICPRCSQVFMHRGNLNTHLKKKNICPPVVLDVNRMNIILYYDIYHQMYKEQLKKKKIIVESIDEPVTVKPELIKPEKPKLKLKLKQSKETKEVKGTKRTKGINGINGIKGILEQYFGEVDEDIIHNITNNIQDIMNDTPAKGSNNTTISGYGSNNTITQNSNNQLHQQFNITVNAYGQEDLSHISQNDWKTIIMKKLDAIPELTKKIYIDEETNRNIYIRSPKDGFGLRYNGDRWIEVSTDKLITDLLQTNTDRLYDYIESEDVSHSIYKTANVIIDKLSEESSVVRQNKSDIKGVLLENKHKILETSGVIKS